MPVHPLELRRIEDGGLLEDTVERKEIAQVFFAHDLAVAARTPSQQREKIAHRLRENPQVLVVADSGRAVPFGKFLPIGSVDHWHVTKDRGHGAKCAVHRELLGGVRDVVVTTNHVCDLHVDVVNDHGEVVQRRAVRPQNHEVADVLALEADAAMHCVLPRQLARRHAEPDRILLHVGFALFEQLIGDLLVPGEARALEDRWLVPVEAEPGETVEDDLCVFIGGTCLVRILDA